jgi:type I restriction enzyme S subunit
MGSGGTPDTDDPTNWSENNEDGYPWIAIADMTGSSLIKSTEKRITQKGLNEKRLKLWPKGTLLFSMYASLGTVSELTIEACTNQAILSLVAAKDVYSPYLKYWLLNMQPYLIEGASSNTQANLNAEKVKNLPLLKPSYAEQIKIANFLDRETTKIDELIQKQALLVELLSERRKSLVAQAVLKGVNKNVELVNTRIDWLGSIPKNWKVLPVKAIFKLVAEPAPDGNDEELLSVFTGIGVRPRKDMEERGNKASSTDGYWVVKKGDIVINKLLAWMGAIGVSNYDGVTSPAYDILRKKIELNSNYYDYLFRSGLCLTEFKKYSRGIMEMRLRLYFEELGQLKMPFPPLEEQNEICKYLDDHLSVYDKLVEKSKHFIELLQEHRSSLISAAVTGKIMVA